MGLCDNGGARGGVLSVWGLGGSEGGSEGVKKGGDGSPPFTPDCCIVIGSMG